MIDLPLLWKRGLRMIGLTVDGTQSGMGVGGSSFDIKQGGLTPDSLELLGQMASPGFMWDIFHSHANAGPLTLTDRHLSDSVIRAVANATGHWSCPVEPFARASLEKRYIDARHTRLASAAYPSHIADPIGWKNLGRGSDLDGDFRPEASPLEIDSVSELYGVGRFSPASFERRYWAQTGRDSVEVHYRDMRRDLRRETVSFFY